MFLPSIGNKEGWSLTVLTQNYPSQRSKAKKETQGIQIQKEEKLKSHGKGPEK